MGIDSGKHTLVIQVWIKKSRDENIIAKPIVDQIAVALGRLGELKGVRLVPAKRRKEIAKKAAFQRWKKSLTNNFSCIIVILTLHTAILDLFFN